ncbi:MAG: esterase family protein, partial [Muribaculaceae bacterium]|nr:esterase family protein [Muribaculaceae bacterium]
MRVFKVLVVIIGVIMSLNTYASLPDYDIIASPTPVSRYGEITRIAVKSENLEASVIVDVWVPADYDAAADKGYPVVYAHDGQNLFDPSYSFAGVPWGLDKACSQLASDSDFEMPIIVGINNRGSEGLRPNDYFPENALDYIPPQLKDETYIYQTCKDIFLGNEEAAFVAKELKPLIDHLYRTAPGMSTTFAMGSSMGALASMYLLCEYPETFGGAACMSTHWIGSLNLNSDYSMNDDEVCANAILDYLSDNIPTDGLNRLYLDQGTEGWDAGYAKYEVMAREIVRGKGFTEVNGTLYVYDAKGAGHNEWFWQQRVKIPLKFLLSRRAIEEAGINYVAPEGSSPKYLFDI